MKPEEFKSEVQNWAKIINVKPNAIHLRKMKRKKASCSSRGRLTFSVKLLNTKPETRDEVIVHELLHLRYPNHGKLFRYLLKTYLRRKPDDKL
ncbi:MAG: M48 family metallopeptidase [candidate division WOR-3 bacterium]